MDDSDTQLIKAMGLDGLPDDEKQEAIENFLTALNNNLGQRVAEVLPDEKVDEFEALLEGEPEPEAVAGWLQQNVPDYMQLVEDEAQKMIAYKDKMLEEALKQMPAQDGKLETQGVENVQA